MDISCRLQHILLFRADARVENEKARICEQNEKIPVSHTRYNTLKVEILDATS